MTWSYSGDPSTSDKDAVRFLTGDTVQTEQLIQDEEIDWLLTEYGSPQRTSYFAALAIAAKCARSYRQETGKIKVWANQKFKQYTELAESMKAALDSGFGKSFTVFVGGISKSDKLARELDPDRCGSPIHPKLHENNTIKP